jgi:DNA-damage-inducible protein J
MPDRSWRSYSLWGAGRVRVVRLIDKYRTSLREQVPSVQAPSATTHEAIAELEAGKGKRCASVAALLSELKSDEADRNRNRG